MTPERGEVWQYAPVVSRPGQSTKRLVVSAPAINANPDLPIVLALAVRDSDPGGLLAVGIAGHGWASALSIEPVMRSRLVERLAVADAATMEHVDAALRAAQDL